MQKLFKVGYVNADVGGRTPEVLLITSAGVTVSSPDPDYQEDDNLNRGQLVKKFKNYLNFDLHNTVIPSEKNDILAEIEGASDIQELKTALLKKFDYDERGSE